MLGWFHVLSREKQQLLLGVSCALVTSVLLILIAVMVKLSSETHHTVEVFFYRSFIALFFSLLVLSAQKKLCEIPKANIKKQVMRAVIGSITMMLMFYCYSILPLAQVQTFVFISPLLVVVLSYPLLKEKVGIYRAAATLVGFIGVVILLQPEVVGSVTVMVVGLTLSLCYAALIICLRWIGRSEKASITVFYFSLISSLMVLPFMPFYFSGMPSPTHMLLFLGIGLSAYILQNCLTMAYKFAPATVIAPINYLNLIWALGFDYLIWSEAPSVHMLVGAFIIIFANIFIIFREQRLKGDGK